MRRRFVALMLSLGILYPISVFAAIEEIQEYSGVVYILYENDSELVRFSLSEEQFLTPIELDVAVSGFVVDGQSIYFSSGEILYKHESGESTEIYTPSREIMDVEIVDDKIVVSTDFYLQSLDKSTFTMLHQGPSLRIDGNIKVSSNDSSIFGTVTGVYPNYVSAIDLSQDGTFIDYRYSNNVRHYVDPLDIFVSPSGEYVFDSKGVVFTAHDVSRAGSFNLTNTEQINDMGFVDDQYILLIDGSLRAYDEENQFTDNYQLSNNRADRFIISTNFAYVFSSQKSDLVEKVDIEWLLRSDPSKPINPTGLAYMPDYMVLDKNEDVLYLLDIEYANVFRYSISQGSYLTSIVLQDDPSQVSYSPTQNRLYVLYTDSVTYVDLNSLQERTLDSEIEPFQLELIHGDVDQHWLAYGDDNLYVLDGNGDVVFQDFWDLYAPDEWTYIPSSKRLYQLENTGLYWFRFDFPSEVEEGHRRESFRHYVISNSVSYFRMSPLLNLIALSDGTLLHSYNMRKSLGHLGGSSTLFSGLTWLHGNAFGIRRNYVGDSSVYKSIVQRFNPDLTISESDTEVFDGLPLGLVSAKQNGAVHAIISVSNVPSIFTLDADHRDFDDDGVLDGFDYFAADPSETEDFDVDGLGNNSDTDNDNDSYPNEIDAFPFNSSEWLDTDGDGIGNNSDPDNDNDGLPDDYERDNLLDPFDSQDANSDADEDGLTALQEYKLGTNPNNRDTDEDGVSDGDEITNKTDPLRTNCSNGLCGSPFRGWRLACMDKSTNVNC